MMSGSSSIGSGDGMTFERFLILRWVGRWILCSREDIGVNPGPYTERSHAERAIEQYREEWPDDPEGYVTFHILECSFPGDPS